MNMKSLFTYLTALTLSFNVFAIEVQKKPNITTSDPTPSVVKTALNQEFSEVDYLAATMVKSHTTLQASAEKPSEFLTELSVYLLIIVVYSVYGFKANSKKGRN